MSQDMHDLQSQPSKRRSSIIQQAKKDGIITDGGDILRGLSETLQPSLLRLSGANRGSTKMAGAKSLLSVIAPTPTMSGARPQASGSGSKPSSIPRPTTSRSGGRGQRKTFMNATTSSTNKASIGPGGLPTGRAYGQSFGTSGRGLFPPLSNQKRPQPPSKGKPSLPGMHAGVPSNSRAKSVVADNFSMGSMRRSCSMDSNTWHSSMMTPTPARSMGYKTPGSLRSWGSQNSLREAKQKTGFRIPGNKDTKQLVNMMHYVHGYLASQGYPNLPASPLELRHISTNAYFNMVTGVGEKFVGVNFFKMVGKDDIINKIVELANILKYPTAISKSHLKSANAQHAWPTCLTFLTWLCCRAEAAYAEEPQKPIKDILTEGFPQIALENYLKIYQAELDDLDSQQVVDEELEKFRNTVSEQLMGEINASVEELEAMKEEKLRELEKIRNVPDPTKEVVGTIEKTEEKLRQVREKIQDTKEKIVKYKDVDKLESRADSLRIQIRCQQSTVENLQFKIKSQPMSRKMADKMWADIEEIRKQRECLKIMLSKLQMDIDNGRESFTELDAKFRQYVSKLSLVETFNSTLSNLGIDGLSVPVNPFSPNELGAWIVTASKILEQTKKASQAWVNAVQRDQQNINDAKWQAEKELISIRQQLETKKVFTKSASRFKNDKERKKIEQVKKMQTEVEKLNSNVDTLEKKLEADELAYEAKQLELSNLNDQLAELQKQKDARNEDREERHAKFLLDQALLHQKLWKEAEKLKTAAAKLEDEEHAAVQEVKKMFPFLFEEKISHKEENVAGPSVKPLPPTPPPLPQTFSLLQPPRHHRSKAKGNNIE